MCLFAPCAFLVRKNAHGNGEDERDEEACQLEIEGGVQCVYVFPQDVAHRSRKHAGKDARGGGFFPAEREQERRPEGSAQARPCIGDHIKNEVRAGEGENERDERYQDSREAAQHHETARGRFGFEELDVYIFY